MCFSLKKRRIVINTPFVSCLNFSLIYHELDNLDTLFNKYSFVIH